MWINVSNAFHEHWRNVGCYHNLREFGLRLDLALFPQPFNKPDLVVFEGFYDIHAPLFATKLRKVGVPYVITPRCSLTRQSMYNHSRLKKRVAHWLIFDRYCRNALAIQYLTKQEYYDSGDKWCKNKIIVPNGFSQPDKYKETFSKEGIRLVTIGRPDIYQKGIDLLVNVCQKANKVFEDAQLHIDLYSPKIEDFKVIQDMLSANNVNNIISLHDAVYGEAKEKVLLESDAFLMTSRFEGHPMALIEALAYGLPAVITKGSNMKVEVESAGAGWTCDGTVDGIYNMLVQLIKEKSLLKQKGVCAKNLAAQYDWGKIALRFHDEIISLLNTK